MADSCCYKMVGWGVGWWGGVARGINTMKVASMVVSHFLTLKGEGGVQNG